MTKRLIIIVILIGMAAVIGVGYRILRPYVWVEHGGHFLPGTETASTSFYEAVDGSCLISVQHADTIENYVFYGATQKLGVANSTQFHFVPGFAFVTDRDVPTVHSDSIKLEGHKLNPTVMNGALRFSTMEGESINVLLPESDS